MEVEQGRHVPDMTRQQIPVSCCSRRKRAVTQCRTASCRHQQCRRVSRSEMTLRSKAENWTNGLGKVAWRCAVKTVNTHKRNLMRSGTLSQCSSRSSGDVCSVFLAEKTSRAAAFRTDCSRCSRVSGAPANTEQQLSSVLELRSARLDATENVVCY